MYTLSKLRRTASYPASLLQPSEFMLSATRPADRCSLLNQAGAAWQHPSARNCCCSHCFMEFIVRVLFSLREKLARSSQVTFSETRQLCLSRAGSTHITLASTRAAGLLTPSREVARLFPGTAACKNRKDDNRAAVAETEVYKHNAWLLKSFSSCTTTFLCSFFSWLSLNHIPVLFPKHLLKNCLPVPLRSSTCEDGVSHSFNRDYAEFSPVYLCVFFHSLQALSDPPLSL